MNWELMTADEAESLAAGLYAGEKAAKKASGLLFSVEWGKIAQLEPSERLCNEPGYQESIKPYLF